MVEQTVKFIATPDIQKLAQKAMDIQFSCDPRPVGKLLSELILSIGLQNPVTTAVQNKLNDLAGLEQTRCEYFTACLDLIDGVDVDWTVYV